MKFAHFADCHVGSWREPKLRDLSTKAFEKAVDVCIEKEVDFVLISGDLFNTSLPDLTSLKICASKFKELRDKDIMVYVIPGSHDFSPSGKTILDVLESSGLFINVVKGKIVNEKLVLSFTEDKKTGVKIAGMLGKRGMLEKSYYESLDKTNLEKESGLKIFMLHTALSEFKPKEMEKMDSAPLSLLPKGFDYYAAGHVHYIFEEDVKGYGKIVYPGPLFPNSFREIEKLSNGGFYLWEDGKTSYQPIVVANTFSIKVDAQDKSPSKVESDIKKELKGKVLFNTIVTIRIKGTLSEGKPSDIDFKSVFEYAYDKGALFVMKNSNKLTNKEFEEVKIDISKIDDVEASLIKEHVGNSNIWDKDKEAKLTSALLDAFDLEKREGEKNYDFEHRVKENVDKVLGLAK